MKERTIYAIGDYRVTAQPSDNGLVWIFVRSELHNGGRGAIWGQRASVEPRQWTTGMWWWRRIHRERTIGETVFDAVQFAQSKAKALSQVQLEVDYALQAVRAVDALEAKAQG